MRSNPLQAMLDDLAERAAERREIAGLDMRDLIVPLARRALGRRIAAMQLHRLARKL